MSESYARAICGWTDRLPEEYRADADAILVAAAGAGMDLRDLTALVAEIYARSRPTPDQDKDEAFEDRSVRLETTFDGAGVLDGDLTPECAAVVGAVLDALSVPAGAEDTRSHAQRYHDALQEAMRRLVAAGLLPERAGQPVKAWVHMSLADLLRHGRQLGAAGGVDRQVRARWAAHRAAASETGGDGGAWLDGDAAEAHRVRRGDGPGRDRGREHRRAGGPGSAVRGTRPGRRRGGDAAARRRRTPPRPGQRCEQAVIGKTMFVLLHSTSPS